MDCFANLRETHAWSSVKLDLYWLKLSHEYVLKALRVAPALIKPQRLQRLHLFPWLTRDRTASSIRASQTRPRDGGGCGCCARRGDMARVTPDELSVDWATRLGMPETEVGRFLREAG